MAEPTDPLASLRRQRALVAEHLAWLDSELHRLSPTTSATPVAADTNADTKPDPAALANARADEILARYAVEERFDPAGTRRGCLLLFSAVLALGFAALVAIYYFGYQNRP